MTEGKPRINNYLWNLNPKRTHHVLVILKMGLISYSKPEMTVYIHGKMRMRLEATWMISRLQCNRTTIPSIWWYKTLRSHSRTLPLLAQHPYQSEAEDALARMRLRCQRL